jgi:TonB family protein
MFFGFCLVLAVVCRGRAQAITEYCPAEVGMFHAVDHDDASLSLYAFTLSAESARSVGGTVLVDSNGGWFVVQFPPAQLTAHTYNYASNYVRFTRTEYESEPIYVRFPLAVKVENAYLAQARSTGDQLFGWDARGDVSCVGIDSMVTDTPWIKSRLQILNPRIDLDAQPPAGATVANASATSAPNPACTQPTAESTITKAASPVFPPQDQGRTTSASVYIKVAISAAGKVDDAWVYYPSGSKSLDAAALAAAKASTYQARVWRCQPVPGIYLFIAEFNP